MSLQAMKAYLSDLLCTVMSEVIRPFVSSDKQNEIKFSKYVEKTYIPYLNSYMYDVNLPQYIINYLKTKAKEVEEYKGVELHYLIFVILTRGIEFNETDFDLIAQGAIYIILICPFPHSFGYDYETVIELGLIIEKLILPYLIKHKAPYQIIMFLSGFSKYIQFEDDFRIGFFPGPDGHRIMTRYSDLDNFNPVKEEIKQNAKNSAIIS